MRSERYMHKFALHFLIAVRNLLAWISHIGLRASLGHDVWALSALPALLFTARPASIGRSASRRADGQIRKKCKETSNLMWLSFICFILVLIVCWNLFCTLANLRIKCVTKTKKVSVLLWKNLKTSFLHDSYIWFWGFITLLVALAHGALPL